MIMIFLNWFNNSEEMLVRKLSEEIFDECGVAESFKICHQIRYPIYAGFFGGNLLVMEVSRGEDAFVIFSGKNNWGFDEDLKKFLVLFYTEKGIYPSFSADEGKLFMKLSKI